MKPTTKEIKCLKCNGKGYYFVNEYFLGAQGKKDCECKNENKNIKCTCNSDSINFCFKHHTDNI